MFSIEALLLVVALASSSGFPIFAENKTAMTPAIEQALEALAHHFLSLTSESDVEIRERCGPGCTLFLADPEVLAECLAQNNEGLSNSECSAAMTQKLHDKQQLLLGIFNATQCNVSCAYDEFQKQLNYANDVRGHLGLSVKLLVASERSTYIQLTEIESGATPWKARAVRRFTLRSMSVKSTRESEKVYEVSVPADISKYVWDWKRSLFLECSDAAKSIRKAKLKNGIPATQFPDAAVDDLVLVRDILLEHGITPLLSSGTMLGWFRECGFIDHDLDTDIAILWEEAKNVSLSDVLFDDPRVRLTRVIERPGSPSEYTVRRRGDKGAARTDIFYLYPGATANNSLTMWSVDGNTGKEFAWTFSSGIQGICAVDFYGHLFYVQCNAADYVRETYGDDWRTPQLPSCWHCNPNSRLVRILNRSEIKAVHKYVRDLRPTANSRIAPESHISRARHEQIQTTCFLLKKPSFPSVT